ncbi:MAG: ATP-binding cassette domain-containing protein [Acidobacteria bacterium]|nr:MAG: ATP-binding cassette domain-containing protein [Acidobacteriota bacterium]REK08320.1 MAG: ATP-binding cassette domain-containing protein [Acidobacteriota bacterium]
MLEGVTKRFGKQTAVDGISMRVPSGSIWGFLGPNGAGKTTTIRMVMSIIYPDEGEIRILGKSNAESIKDRLGYLPEEKGLYKKMTAGEIVAYFGRLKGMAAGDAKRRARELLEQYGLGDAVDKKCEALSKGMGQKVQILGTVIHDPDLVILDEPFSGLDPVNAEVMKDLILQMKRDGRTVIFSTHIMLQAEQLCDGLTLINHGRKVLDGTMAEVRGSEERGILLDYDGDSQKLHSLDGIERINDSGKQAEIFPASGVDPQHLLQQIVQRVHVRRFDLREPSLHEIFVRAVGGRADGVAVRGVQGQAVLVAESGDSPDA